MMYRVVIVDDEIWSVIGLKKILAEDALRFALAYETADPADALEQICKLRPDVVFTDVRMPEMSGIDLMRQVKLRGIKTQFVVISGFAEFSYVQQALQQGALDYQLKPFDRSMGKQMLDRVYEKLENARTAGDLEFYSLLRDKKSNISELLQRRIGNAPYHSLQLVVIYRHASTDQKILIALGEEAHCLTLKIGPRKWLYVINSSKDLTETIYSILCANSSEIEVAGLSRVGKLGDSFSRLLNEAETAALDSFVYPQNNIFKYRKPKRALVSRVYDRMAGLERDRKYEQVAELVSSWYRLFPELDMSVEDTVSLWNKIAFSSAQNSKTPDEILEYLDLYELTARFSSLQEMSSFLYSKYEFRIVEKSSTANDKFFELLRYIDEHYDRQLSLKDLCGMFYINMSYCCELFQKHRNMTFSQYLTEVRIKKACDLLKYKQYTVAEACEKTGYKDYFYFNKVFKKKVGCTPAEYRKKYSNGGMTV